MGEFDALVTFAQKFGQAVTQASGIAPGFQATRASVVDSFVGWSTPLEGMTNYPYTDAEGLVTTGMGDLIDGMASGQTMHTSCGHGTSTPCGQATPTAAARALPWNPNNLDADWAAIKAAWPGVQSVACKGITTSRLDADAIQNLIASRMKDNEAFILKGLPNFAQAPADAQLAVHSMSWAMGPSFTSTWPAFRTAFNAGDYATAADQSHMRGVGIDMRNLANKLLLENASKAGIDPDHLYYLEGIGGAVMAFAGGPLTLYAKFQGLPTWQKALIGVGTAAAIVSLVYGVVSLASND
jgi:GH24 family phage-related lysozyme (muramidase)